MLEPAKIAGWLLSPLSLALLLWGLAMWLLWSGHRRLGLGVGLLTETGLWAVATPLAGHTLAYPLERRVPALLAEQVPLADALVLLGGALSGAHPPERPSFDLGRCADRVWHAAALFRRARLPGCWSRVAISQVRRECR